MKSIVLPWLEKNFSINSHCHCISVTLYVVTLLCMSAMYCDVAVFSYELSTLLENHQTLPQ